ncbi:MAG: 2-aminomuconic 6-semialdehyde dehydrogenase [Candidatus Heimdallarchaeota archaeon LC_2]|nr:MAG: 2-aminomuconic 6-semialdehyde dehydrogenase [Candidatus Heimdallarchaeota archaeon LC_2]
MEKLENYIGGKLVAPINEKYIENINPSNGKVYSLIPNSNERDVLKAINAAEGAFSNWSLTPIAKRSKILLKIAELIDNNLDILSEAESKDNGKPIKLAKSVDIPRAAANFHFYGTAILHSSTHSYINEDTSINYTLRQPIGIVGCISPWNLPLYLFTWKIAPALAAGNCVVAKPSEITPMTAYLLSKICIEAGLPPGVLNIVHGYGPDVGEIIIKHQKIKAISFTGGTVTGARIASIAAPMFKKLSLELGGKNPNIIFADCNFEQMIETTVRSSFRNQGEICLCGSRIFVERPIYQKFKDEFVERTKQLIVGDPKKDTTDLGAIVSKQHFDKIMSYIELAKEEGGVILTGGKSVEFENELKNGFYIQPTIIEELDHLCKTNQEEIFGPVVTIMPFDTEIEVLEYANSTIYGLSATIWTENLNRAHRMAANVQSGIIWVNCWMVRDLRTLFGGMKNSGVGREGGFEALNFFTEAKNVTIKLK